MKKVFYSKISVHNLINNRVLYMPYILASILSISMFYVMYGLSQDGSILGLSGGSQIKEILSLGSVVIGIFTTIFILYTNSFLIKRRKKEIGLYNILGMEKKHIVKMMLIESVIILVITLICGIFIGIVFSKLMLMVLAKLISFTIPFTYTLSPKALLVTTLLYIGIMVCVLTTNLLQVHLSKPIALLKGSNIGEKEPKSKWVFTLIGLIALGIGYGIALVVHSPLEAISLFFVAVILVMIGTYYLFTTGSIVILKMLRNNRKFYYHKNNFISVSSMIYRMKQNAVGLANICILSTAVLIMLSTTTSLYLGLEDSLKNRFPREIILGIENNDNEASDQLVEEVQSYAKDHGVVLSNELSYHTYSSIANRQDNRFDLVDGNVYQVDSINFLIFMLVEDLNASGDEVYTLDEDEVILYTTADFDEHSEMIFDHQPYKIKTRLDSLVYESVESDLVSTYYIFMKDRQMIDSLIMKGGNIDHKDMNFSYEFDINMENEVAKVWINDLMKVLGEQFDEGILLSNIYTLRASFLDVHGCLLFIGVFLGILFLMATVLIIYYKQISEGYEDQERYKIMQQVGMSIGEVKSAINKQVIMVFFLPLVSAFIHIVIAFKMITRLLLVFNFTNTNLFIGSTVLSCFVFGVIYIGVYYVTSRAYYRIVIQ